MPSPVKLRMSPVPPTVTLESEGWARATPARARGESTEAGPQVTGIFQSDWSFGTGDTSAVCSDNGKWNGLVVNPGADWMDVIAAPVGFPAGMANVHRQYYRVGAPGIHLEGLADLAIGSTRHMRWYFCDNSTYVASSNPDHHQFLPNPNETFWAINHSPPGGTAYWAFTVYDDTGAGQHRYRYNGIQSGEVYKVRFSFTRLTSTTFTVSAGLWLVDGTPVAVDGDLSCNHHGAAHPLDPNAVHGQPVSNWPSLTGVRISIEGVGGGETPGPTDYTLTGGWAIVDDADPEDYGHVVGEATN